MKIFQLGVSATLLLSGSFACASEVRGGWEAAFGDGSKCVTETIAFSNGFTKKPETAAFERDPKSYQPWAKVRRGFFSPKDYYVLICTET